MRIFLDVGAHIGQTARAVLEPRYRFDRVVCFEPAEACWSEIAALSDPRLQLLKFGLWRETCRKPLYDPGYMGGSLFPDMETVRAGTGSVSVDLVRARDWFVENVPADALVFMKLNCEGAECDIVEDLLDAGLLPRVYNLMIDFDVRKSPTLRGRERVLRRRLREAELENVAFSEDVMVGPTHEDRTRHWLDLVGAADDLERPEVRARYQPTLKRLSSRSGALARWEQAIRGTLYARLPAPVKKTARAVWRRFMHGG
jgi:FkbM family methyltransferase